jgi:nucleoside 2-deoxyribosyltransferase
MKSVTICGSGKFKDEARVFAQKLRDKGIVVFEPHYWKEEKYWENLSNEQKEMVARGLTHDHFQKIRMGDVIYFYNKDGYSGNSSSLELGFAVALGKIIYALAKDTSEVCRDILYKEIVTTPESLFEKLK